MRASSARRADGTAEEAGEHLDSEETLPLGPRPRETPAETTRPSPGGEGRMGRALRGLSGGLTAGLLVLTVVLCGVQLWGLGRGNIGPGWSTLAGHALGSAVALFAQLRSDRSHRRGAVVGYSLGALGVVLAVLVQWWWS